MGLGASELLIIMIVFGIPLSIVLGIVRLASRTRSQPAIQSPPPGWWLASDGRWYPPQPPTSETPS